MCDVWCVMCVYVLLGWRVCVSFYLFYFKEPSLTISFILGVIGHILSNFF